MSPDGGPAAIRGRHRRGVRIEESRQEVERLSQEFDAWLSRRRASDPRGQYASQLTALEYTVGAVVRAAREGVAALGPSDGAASVHAGCRRSDVRIVFARRVWDFFRRRFDQRDDPTLGPVLAAADEVVWSCYSQAFVGVGADPPTAPLPYIEAQQSPRALARSVTPAELASDARDPVLRDALKALPIPVVGLPSICVARPWWLIYLAHETGHQLQADLGDGALRDGFPELIDSVTGDRGESAWCDWTRECFADAASVLASGSGAARAMWDLEAGDAAALVRSVPGYPPPVVRRALMDGIVDASRRCLGEVGDAAASEAATAAEPAIEAARAAIADAELGDADEPLRRSAARALGDVGAIVGAIVARPVLAGAVLLAICGRRPDDEERIASWAADFRQPDAPFPEYRRESARLAIAGAYAAWVDVASLDDEERDTEQRRLRETVPSTVSRCGEPATRAALEIPRERLERAAATLVDEVLGRLGDDPL